MIPLALETKNLEILAHIDTNLLDQTTKEIIEIIKTNKTFNAVTILQKSSQKHLARYIELCNQGAKHVKQKTT